MAEAGKAKRKLPKGRHKSQIKRQKQSVKGHERNVQAKSALKTAMKKVRQAVVGKDKPSAEAFLKSASRLLQKAASQKVIHSRNASRHISRLATLVGQI